jgi:hypothetical protein
VAEAEASQLPIAFVFHAAVGKLFEQHFAGKRNRNFSVFAFVSAAYSEEP